MKRPVRVRFAPSPTGHLHIGGVRSALFNWLWAKHNNGTFILRIEDTDRARLVEGAIEQINASLIGLGIEPDEGPLQGGYYGPYIQSQRLDLYQQYADELVQQKSLYPCWCSAERLDQMRQEAQKSKVAFRYDRHCLKAENTKDLADPHVLRFKIPDQPSVIEWDDAVRGQMSWRAVDLDDFVAIKSDGYPTYQFANVVDDHLMDISHVLRADEWLPSTAKHLLLFAALGWEPPVYAHLPAILGPGGNKKLSKRDGAQSVEEYLTEGFLPEALRSYLATLGWNDGTTQEIYTTTELIDKFELSRVQKSPAMLDRERLDWVNGVMIRQLPIEALLPRLKSFWPPNADTADQIYLKSVLVLVHERLKRLAELPELTEFFFSEPTPSVQLLCQHLEAGLADKYLAATLERLSSVTWSQDALETAIRALSDELGVRPGHYFGLLRVAITGRTAAPGLFETFNVLGPARSLSRLEAALRTVRV